MNDIDIVYNKVYGLGLCKCITVDPAELKNVWGEPMTIHRFRAHLAKIKATRGLSFKTKTDKKTGRVKVMRVK